MLICLKRQKPGKVQIKAYYNFKVLDIREAKMKNGTEIILCQSHGRDNQIFDMIYNSDDTVTFKNKNFAIDIKDGEAKEGAIIQISEYTGTISQRFYLINTGYGNFNIHSAINPRYVITLCDEETKDINKVRLSWLYSQYTSTQGFNLVYK